jgi:hypothetical protein
MEIIRKKLYVCSWDFFLKNNVDNELDIDPSTWSHHDLSLSLVKLIGLNFTHIHLSFIKQNKNLTQLCTLSRCWVTMTFLILCLHYCTCLLFSLSLSFFLSIGRKKECKIGMRGHNFIQKNVKEVSSLTYKGWC